MNKKNKGNICRTRAIWDSKKKLGSLNSLLMDKAVPSVNY